MSSGLHNEFRTIIMILMVATAANQGYPILVPTHGDGLRSIHAMINSDDDGKEKERTIAMTDLATLLVRNEEIVSVSPIDDKVHSSSFAVFTNASKHGTYFKEPDQKIMVVAPGRSLWPIICNLTPMEVMKLRLVSILLFWALN